MSVKQALLLCLLLEALALGTCLKERSFGHTAPTLQGSVTPIGGIEADQRPHCSALRTRTHPAYR